MSISSVTSTDWTSILTSMSSSSSSKSTSRTDSSKTDPQKLWDSLSDALESGDLDAAKSAFETLKANMPEPPPGGRGMGPGGQQGEDGEDPFESLQAALEAGDVEAAQELLAEMEANRPSGPPPGGKVDPSFNNDTTGAVGNAVNLLA